MTTGGHHAPGEVTPRDDEENRPTAGAARTMRRPRRHFEVNVSKKNENVYRGEPFADVNGAQPSAKERRPPQPPTLRTSLAAAFEKAKLG